MKYLKVSLVLALFLVGASALAQEHPTVNPPDQDPTMTCLNLQRNLWPGTRSNLVKKFQEFLMVTGDYEADEATGFFGRYTRKAMTKFQNRSGLSDLFESGRYVGSQTRAKIKQISCPTGNCENVACPAIATTVCPVGTRPVRIDNGCCPEYKCVPTSKHAPVINGISGPTTLTVNQKGTWTIQASDPDNGSLSYNVTWGDEQVFPNYAGEAVAKTAFVQTATFQHTYSRSGTFSPTFFVNDGQGNQVSTSLSVRVGAIIDDGGLGNIRVISPNGGENWLPGESRTISWSAAQIPCGNYPSIGCSVAGRADQFDVKIRSYFACLYNTPACKIAEAAPLTIAQNVYGSTFLWSVGQIRLGENGVLAPVQAQYQIGVCYAGTSSCDWSDTAFTINGQVVNDWTLKLTSPNGGEQWPARSTRTISWNLPGNLLPGQLVKVDLFLDSYYPPCVTDTCPMYPFRSPVTLDKNISGYGSYSWIVATDIVNNSIPNGQYQVRVCRAGTNTCDSSDRPFTITNSIISDGNKPPVINGITGPTSVTVGQTNTWTVSAYDPEGEIIYYSFSWCNLSAGTCVHQATLDEFPTNNKLAISLREAGAYRINVAATDIGGRRTTTSVTTIASWGPNL